ncbi:hypothetical protein MBLNU230_g4580t1 [Neophaeotheca triangularis]
MQRKPSDAWNGSPVSPSSARDGLSDSHYGVYDLVSPIGEGGHHVGGSSRNVDDVGRHLLYETAMIDSRAFEILDMSEVDALKKEHARLGAKLEAAQRKFALESKVRDAAQNLHRLYSTSSKSRADTPQSPSSPRKSRTSLLSNRQVSGSSIGSGSGSGGTLSQAEDEVALSNRKVDELNLAIKGLMERQQYVERKLLRHTAAALAEQRDLANRSVADTEDGGGDSASEYSPDEFDGIRDILVGKTAGSSRKLQKRGNADMLHAEHEHQMSEIQDRLEHLNSELRQVIGDASRARGKTPEPDIEVGNEHHDVHGYVDKHLYRIEHNLRIVQDEQEGMRTHFTQIQQSEDRNRNAIKMQLENVNNDMHRLLSETINGQSLGLQPPPASDHGYQSQLQYMEQIIFTLDQLFQQHDEALHSARKAGHDSSREIEEAQAKAANHAKQIGEYETVLGGLWEIMQSDSSISRSRSVDRGLDDGSPPPSPFPDSFSLPAFSSRVQNLFDRASSAKEQHDILRRQIQQQRELNGKSDAEKDKQFAELETNHEQLQRTHEELVDAHHEMQDELAATMVKAEQASTEANETRAELLNVTNELEQLQRTISARQDDQAEMSRQLEAQRGNTVSLESQIEELEAQVSDLTDDARILAAENEAKLSAANNSRESAEEKHTTLKKDMDGLEAEVVRLTTELTMAKAELDGAYGSRSERKKEAQAAEIEALNDRNDQVAGELQKLREHHQTILAELATVRNSNASTSNGRTAELEKELYEMTNDFQDLTRESMQLEKEREQLDTLIDGLRERCETLENQLSDEKVRWLGIKSPSGAGAEGANGREMTSTMVLRQEFKKMMRETRAEGMRALRAEQEERRRVESELRRLRHTNGSLGSGRVSAHSQRLSNGGSGMRNGPTSASSSMHA